MSRRAVGQLKDRSGFLELTWFQGINWIQKTLNIGESYLVYGRVSFFKGQPQIVHPEIEILTKEKEEGKDHLEPVYPSTEKLKSKFLGGRQIGKLTKVLWGLLHEKDIPVTYFLCVVVECSCVCSNQEIHGAYFG